MPTDNYTKGVLTCIALCLVVLVLKGTSIFHEARANYEPELSKHNVQYGLVPLNADGSIDVRVVASDIMDVRIRGIHESEYMLWQPINVRITD